MAGEASQQQPDSADRSRVVYEKKEIHPEKVVSVMYELAENRKVVLDPAQFAIDSSAAIGQKVIGSLPETWEPGSQNAALRSRFNAQPNHEFFSQYRGLSNVSRVPFPGSAAPYMDPLGMMNPASNTPVSDELLLDLAQSVARQARR